MKLTETQFRSLIRKLVREQMLKEEDVEKDASTSESANENINLPADVERALKLLTKAVKKYEFNRQKLQFLFDKLIEMLELDKKTFQRFTTKKRSELE